MPSETKTNPPVLWPYRGPERKCWYGIKDGRPHKELAVFISGTSKSGSSALYCEHHARKNAGHGWFSLVEPIKT